MHVQVRHLQPGDDHPGTLGTERLAHRLADQLRDLHDPAEHRRPDVLPLVDLFARYDERGPASSARSSETPRCRRLHRRTGLVFPLMILVKTVAMGMSIVRTSKLR